VRFDLSDYDAILDKFGNKLLPSYDFARSERMQMLAIQFLEATAPHWVVNQDVPTEFASNSRDMTNWFIKLLAKCRISSWKIRLSLLGLLDLTVRLDPSSSAFDDPDVESSVLPVTIIPRLIIDPDFHVRYHVAACIAHLFEICQRENAEIDRLWTDVSIQIPRDLDNFEVCVTAFLVLANIMIVSGRARRAPYDEILTFAVASQAALPDSSRYNDHIECALSNVASRLGLRDLAHFYLLFAGHVTRRSILRKQEHLRLPDRLCGYRTRKECVAAAFKETSAAFIAGERMAQFESHCNVLGKTRAAGLRECLPAAAADILIRGLARALRSHDPDTGAIQEAGDRIMQLARETELVGMGDDDDERAVVCCMADQFMAEILALFYEADCTPRKDGPLLVALHDQPEAAQVLSKILAKAPTTELYAPCPPFAGAYDIVQTCRWMDHETDVFKQPAAVYGALLHLFTLIVQKPFINDQLRHLYAVALCLAFTGAWNDATILRMVIHALTICHRQPELAPLTGSMLEWAVTSYLSLPVVVEKGDEWLSTILANAARAAHSHANSNDVVVRSSGLGLLVFLENRVRKLSVSSNEKFQSQATRAALLWPRGDLSMEDPEVAEIRETLDSPTVKTGKFRLARSLTKAKRSTRAESSRVGWRILASNPSGDQIDLESSLAFVDFLFSNCGAVHPPTLRDVSASASGPVKSTKTARSAVLEADDTRASLVSLMLVLMLDDDFKLVELAASTLRTIYALGSKAGTLPPPVEGELNLLATPGLARTFEARQSPFRALDDLASPEWLKKSENVDAWLRDFTTFLADVQGCCAEPFYSQLVPLLSQSFEFSKHSLPLIVHSILHREISQRRDTARISLSRYFGAILVHPQTDSRCTRHVVDIVNYFRQHPQPGSSSLVSGDLWLQLDWTQLGRAAAGCGRYHDCLLFLELAREHGGEETENFVSTTGKSTDSARQLLYEIYEHVDDPDGFYGIQSDDFKETLIRRYHHEERWTRAFKIHAADFESSMPGSALPSSAATVSIVESLAASGFHRLALSVLRPASASGGIGEGVSSNNGLPYELAWRTQQWDIPLERNAQTTSAASLFSALRAIHRERDESTAMEALDASIVGEMRKAATVSADLPMPNREALATLLSLREVRMWRLECFRRDRLPDKSKAWLRELDDGFR
jgi:ataxia telangiectasia mutated family protein